MIYVTDPTPDTLPKGVNVISTPNNNIKIINK